MEKVEKKEIEKNPKIKFFEWTEEHEEASKEILEEDKEILNNRIYKDYDENANKYWNIFFRHNGRNFYKDRHYIDREFGLEDLITELKTEKERRLTLLEIGCAVGNTIFPLSNKFKEDLFVYGFDFSKKAIDLIIEKEEYNEEDMKVDVFDLVKDDFSSNYPKVDFITLIFVLSAISPENHLKCLKKIYDQLDENSYFYFRDYGLYDLAQIRFAMRKDAKLKDNFYLKSDGTRCYYFDEEYMKELLTQTGFEIKKAETHYREVNNKKLGKKMHRVWVQAICFKGKTEEE